MRVRKVILTLFVFTIWSQTYSQEPIFNGMNKANKIYYNPAALYSKKASGISVGHLYQRNYNGEDYHSTLTVADTWAAFHGSLGLIVLNDNYINSNDYRHSFEGIYSFPFQVSSRAMFKFACNIGYVTGKIDPYNYTDRYGLYSGFDAKNDFGYDQSLLTIGSGIEIATYHLKAGVSVRNINKPIEFEFQGKDSRLPMFFSGNFNYRIELSSIAIRPQLMYQTQDERYYMDTLDVFLLKNYKRLAFSTVFEKWNRSLRYGIEYNHLFNRRDILSQSIGYDFRGVDIAYNLGLSIDDFKNNEIDYFHYITAAIDFNFGKSRVRPASPRVFGPGAGLSFARGKEVNFEHDLNTEEYDVINDNSFKLTTNNPLSTFSIDVDNASYSNFRRYINANQLPPIDAIRIEEFLNYFDYAYQQPKDETPFAVHTEYAQCPWNTKHNLLKIGIKGKDLNYDELKPSNLVFLIDVSGSMDENNKLPLLKKAMKLLVDQLSEKDKVAIVVYASKVGTILKPTSALEKDKIKKSIDKLEADGYTAGGKGIQSAYALAKENYIADGNNRVILCTDGDFNIGVSSTSKLVRLIEKNRQDDIYLTICGFGMGNLKDGRMEQISNAGNGNYFYIDNINEGERVFCRNMRANMFTIAKDVKIQIEFNPLKVKQYRLIGYENRVLEDQDFNDDLKDAGELGAGHTVTAFYEIVPNKLVLDSNLTPSIDDLKYQKVEITKKAKRGNELSTLKIRYKPPKDTVSLLITEVIKDRDVPFSKASDDYKFAASVVEFGLLMRDSKYKGQASFENVLKVAKESIGKDENGDRSEFIKLVKASKLLKKD